MFNVNVVSADTIKIPFSCWPKELKAAFYATGRKLDINSSDRTDDSWGFVNNEGSNFEIYTYRSATKEDFEVIQRIVFDIEFKKGQ